MCLNKSKYEHLQFNTEDRGQFMDQTHVPIQHEAKYLGRWLNDKDNPNREPKKRITDILKSWK